MFYNHQAVKSSCIHIAVRLSFYLSTVFCNIDDLLYTQILLTRHLNPVFATGALVIPTSVYFLLKVNTNTILMFRINLFSSLSVFALYI